MNLNKTYDVGVVGGGISGLIAAKELAAAGKKVVLFEAGNELGGLAGSFHHNGYEVEKFYHHFFHQDNEVMALIDEMGLYDDLIEARTKSGFYFDGAWYDVSSPLKLLSFKPLSFFERISFGQTLLKARSEKEPLRLDDVSVEEWLNLREGTGMYTVFHRMLQGKFGIGVDQVSAAFLSDRFRARSQKRSVSSKQESFFYLRSSLKALIKAIEKNLLALGVDIAREAPVLQINRKEDGLLLDSGEMGEVEVKTVISSISPEVFARVAGFLSEAEEEKMLSIKYGAVICSILGLDRAISPFYWGTICDLSIPFQLLADQTKLVGEEHYNGDYIYYASRYCSQEELAELDMESYEQKIRDNLKKVGYSGDEPEVLWQNTFTNANATPIFSKGYLRKIKALPEMDRVWMTGMPFIYPFARNLNSMVRIARRTAADVLSYFQGERVSSYCSLHE